MAIQSFNSLAGYSVGDSNTLVIDENVNITANDVSITGQLSITGTTNSSNVIPSADNTYLLGNSTNRWANIWLGPGTIYMTDTANANSTAALTVTNGILQVNGAAGLQANLISGNTTLNLANSGSISMSVAGTANVLTVNSSNVAVTGNLATSGNISVGNISVTGNIYANPIYASVWSNVTQNTVSNTVQVLTFNNLDGHNGIVLGNGTSNSQLIVNHAGIYNLQFSAQLYKTTSGLDDVYIWIRKNGNDLANTTGYFSVDRQTAAVQSWNFIVDAANVGDYFELATASTSATISFPAYPSQSTPYARPQIPSIIATITPVGA